MSIDIENLSDLINYVKTGKSISQEQFLNAFSYQDSYDRYFPYEKYTQLAAELIEIVNQKLSDTIDVNAIYNPDISIVKLLAERELIDNRAMLKIALKTNKYSADYLTYTLPIQAKIIESCIDRGLNLKDFSIDELNIVDIHFSILKLLSEKGLHPQALEIRQAHKNEGTEIIELAINNNLKLSSFSLIYCLFFKEDMNFDFLKSLINSTEIQINHSLSLDEIESFVTFKKHNFREYIQTNQACTFTIFEKEKFNDGSTLLHLLTKLNKYELLKSFLNNYDVDVNIKNKFGKTPLFFAKDYLITKLLISHQADLTVTDNNGNTFLNNIPLSILNYVTENSFLPKDYAFKYMQKYLEKGNFEYAAKLVKLFDFKLDLDPIDELINSIISGLFNSIEHNKYQILVNLINKAGIEIPNEYKYLLSSYHDDHELKEFKFTDGLLHKLAKHYINLAKSDYVKSYNNKTFDDYFKIFGKASTILDNDFTLEALTINGLRPDKLGKDVLVYRGMTTILSPEDIDAYFKYGHRAFSVGENQKTLGFYVNEEWNKSGVNHLLWEFGGTYTALQPFAAAIFAIGESSITPAKKGTLLEIMLPGDSPKICGGWQDINANELITGTIKGENIIAIYEVTANDDGNFTILNYYLNPYVTGKIYPNFQLNTKIILNYEDNQKIEELYNLGCKNLPIADHDSTLYKDYTDFMEQYTPEKYLIDQIKLREDYFQGRESYVEDFFYGLVRECDLNLECCVGR